MKTKTDRIEAAIIEMGQYAAYTIISAAVGSAAVLTISWFALASALAATTQEAIPVSTLNEIMAYVMPLSVIGACIGALLYTTYSIGKAQGALDKTEVTEWKS